MSSDNNGDAVAEYLNELELRLTGLPVLQRRELLADLEAHITNERAERGAISESELLEILERLGSPEVVAAAAYEEAGLLQPHSSPAGQPLAASQPAFAGAPSLSGAGAGLDRSLPPVPPPPDAPPVAGPYPPFSQQPSYAAPPAFSGPPFFAESPLAGRAPAEPAGKTGLRIAVAVAIVSAIFLLLACLAGSFLMSNSSPTEEASYVPAAPTDVAPLPGN
jgi:hypothetical protein